MESLYNEVCEYMQSHNGISDNLYNGILLEVYMEYSCNYKEENKLLTLEELEDIADNIIGSDKLDEIFKEELWKTF